MAEQSRVALRNIRRDGIDELKQLEKAKIISEDQLKVGEDKIQKVTDSFVKIINDVLSSKEKEIMEVYC